MTDQFENSEFASPRLFVSFADLDEEDEKIAIAMAHQEPVAGQLIGNNYVIINKIGEGAMASVYKAKQSSTGRLVAIKTLKFVDPTLAERFAREVKIHSRLKHENIVEAIECITTPHGRSYFIMELLQGMSLEDHIDTKGRFNNPTDIANILSQICEALEYAHEKGIIHRDVKPENIILTHQDGRVKVKVLDFGVAKIQEDLQRLTKTGVVLGSPAYMSPEQCMGMDLDHRSDLYSLAVVAYEMVTGQLPFEAETPVQMMEAHCDPTVKPTPLAKYRNDLSALVKLQSALSNVLISEADKRTQTVDQFKMELEIWWRAATAGSKDLPSPFHYSEEKQLPSEKNKGRSIFNTIESRALDSLSGRTTPSKDYANKKGPETSRKKLSPLIGIIIAVVVIIGLSVGLAFFIITSLHR